MNGIFTYKTPNCCTPFECSYLHTQVLHSLRHQFPARINKLALVSTQDGTFPKAQEYVEYNYSIQGCNLCHYSCFF